MLREFPSKSPVRFAATPFDRGAVRCGAACGLTAPCESFPRKRESIFAKVKMDPRWSLPRQAVSRGGDDENFTMYFESHSYTGPPSVSFFTNIVRLKEFSMTWSLNSILRPSGRKRNPFATQSR